LSSLSLSAYAAVGIWLQLRARFKMGFTLPPSFLESLELFFSLVYNIITTDPYTARRSIYLQSVDVQDDPIQHTKRALMLKEVAYNLQRRKNTA